MTICVHNKLKIFGEIVRAGLVPAHNDNHMIMSTNNNINRATTRVAPTIIHNDSIQMILNNIGKLFNKIIIDYFKYKNIELDEYIIMPDHIHLIIIIKNKFNIVGAGLVPAHNDNNMIMATNNNINKATTRVAPTIGQIIGEIKSIFTNEYIKNNYPSFEKRLFQRNYYEHIIRNEKEYLLIKQYIRDNIKNWIKTD